MKNILYAAMFFCVAVLNGMEVVDDALSELGQMLQGCVIEKPLVAPSNTPSSRFEQDMQDVFEEPVDLITCRDPECLYSCATQGELQSHMWAEHGLFMCLCGDLFEDYDLYNCHIEHCSR